MGSGLSIALPVGKKLWTVTLSARIAAGNTTASQGKTNTPFATKQLLRSIAGITCNNRIRPGAYAPGRDIPIYASFQILKSRLLLLR